MEYENITLPQHEAASEKRAEHVMAKIDDSKGEHDMAQPVNVFTTPNGEGGSMASLAPMAMMAAMGGPHGGLGGGLGAGLGAGLVGGLLGGLIFGGGRGPWGGGGVVDNTLAVGRETAQIAFDTVALQSLNGISAAIPAQAGSVKDAVLSAIAGLSSDVASGFAAQTSNSLQQTILLTQQASAIQAATQAAINAANMNTSDQGSRTRETVVADGAATRALLTNRWQLEDATEINKLNAQVIELREEGRHRELGGKIEIQNTAIAAQQQGQQQQQQQQLVATVNSLFPLLQGVLQVAHATNSNVIAGNTGAVTTGAQTSTPTNVNA
jgi:hypothetical protein